MRTSKLHAIFRPLILMTAEANLTLDGDDPLVVAAREAEERLYAGYGLNARTRHIRLPGLDLRVRVSEFGSGPPILIVPGNTGDAFPLASLMAMLAGRRTIAVNRPGGGLSDGMDYRTVDIRHFAVDTMTTILDEMGLDQVDVGAHSMGAHWSLWLAMDRPERVRRLVTLGNPGRVMKGDAPLILRLLTKPPLSMLLGRLVTPRKRTDAMRPLKMMGHDLAVMETLPVAFGDCYFHFRRLPHYRVSLLSLMQNAPRLITAEDLAGIEQPVALLWGTKDTFAGTDVGRAVASALPNGELHPLEGAGHLPWLEYPETSGKLILEFLDR